MRLLKYRNLTASTLRTSHAALPFRVFTHPGLVVVTSCPLVFFISSIWGSFSLAIAKQLPLAWPGDFCPLDLCRIRAPAPFCSLVASAHFAVWRQSGFHSVSALPLGAYDRRFFLLVAAPYLAAKSNRRPSYVYSVQSTCHGTSSRVSASLLHRPITLVQAYSSSSSVWMIPTPITSAFAELLIPISSFFSKLFSSQC